LANPVNQETFAKRWRDSTPAIDGGVGPQTGSEPTDYVNTSVPRGNFIVKT
jgi:hypothetical protein